MGLDSSYLAFIESSIARAYPDTVNGLRMLELGDQVIFDTTLPEETGKAYFANRGFEHVSVDINGLHGAVVRDLTRPEQFFDWHSEWDVLTNAGTTEHVEPFESQYECFSIIHDCLKTGGLAVHLVPDVYERDVHNAWANHCRFYYSESFFEMLAKECQYELLSCDVINGLRCAALRKSRDVPFMNDRARFLGAIAQRGDAMSTGDDASTMSVKALLRRVGMGRLLRRIGLR